MGQILDRYPSFQNNKSQIQLKQKYKLAQTLSDVVGYHKGMLL